MCVVWQHLTYKTKRKTPQATSVEKRRKNGAILFGWGDSLLRDMLDAGVFDCLNGEFERHPGERALLCACYVVDLCDKFCRSATTLAYQRGKS